MRSHSGMKWMHLDAPRTRLCVSVVLEGTVILMPTTSPGRSSYLLKKHIRCVKVFQNSVSVEAVNIHELWNYLSFWLLEDRMQLV